MSSGTGILLRFCIVYFALYSLGTQIIGGVLLTPWFSFPALGTVWPMREITNWLAEHVFGVRLPILYTGNSGDTVFHWIQTAWLLALAMAITAAWRTLQPGRSREERWHRWFRVFIRFAMAAQMFYYGMAKIIPTQFPPPSLVTLVESVGNLSLSDLLWTHVGASLPYQVFTGCAEMLSGILLLAPRTTLLGALIGLADMTQVFVLNMTYDFGLKQISFHYLLMFAFLIAPDARRLANVLVLNRSAEPSSPPDLFSTPLANRIALVAQVVFGIYLIGMFTWVATRSYYAEGGPGVDAIAALRHLERGGAVGGRPEPAAGPERLRSPLASRHLRHARRPRLSAHRRFVRALRSGDRYQPPHHRVDQAKRRKLARRFHLRTAVIRSTRARGDDGRVSAADSAATGRVRYLQAAQQSLPVDSSAGPLRRMRSSRRGRRELIRFFRKKQPKTVTTP